MNLKYDAPKEITKAEFSNIVSVGVIALICEAIVRAVHFIYDYDWLVEQFVPLLNHPSPEVRGTTITCFGHLARLNQDANKQQLLRILEPLLADEQLAGRIEDAIDDINTFL